MSSILTYHAISDVNGPCGAGGEGVPLRSTRCNNLWRAPDALLGLAPARIVNENVAHRLAGYREKVGLAFPLGPLLIDPAYHSVTSETAVDRAPPFV